MPTYKVTAPDGRTYRVTAPPGASQEQVFAFAKQNYTQIARDRMTSGVNINWGGQPLDFQRLRDAVEWQESRGNPNAVSPKGAKGRMQTMPHTLRDPGYGVKPARDDSDAELTRVGNEYLQAMLREYNDPRLALAAYNWGPGNVNKALKRTKGDVDALLQGAPKETQDYVRKILGRYNRN